MKGAIMTVPGEPLELLDIELGTVEPHEVQVRVERASVCHTDLTIAQGNFPMPVP
ncbi:MAG: alcohol dehydrogenase catalytic domain-containing protein, partial [Gammaproteobacteria bacterium]|nr:alcohol dehydrogenase catalytic domain-containing protein [Gammaproteobacteria bacterium]